MKQSDGGLFHQMNLCRHLEPSCPIFTSLCSCCTGIVFLFTWAKIYKDSTEKDIAMFYTTIMLMVDLKIWDYVKLDMKHFLFIFVQSLFVIEVQQKKAPLNKRNIFFTLCKHYL